MFGMSFWGSILDVASAQQQQMNFEASMGPEHRKYILEQQRKIRGTKAESCNHCEGTGLAKGSKKIKCIWCSPEFNKERGLDR